MMIQEQGQSEPRNRGLVICESYCAILNFIGGLDTFGERPLTVSKLLCSCTHIISARVAENVFERFLLGNILACFGNNEGKLCFIITRIVLCKLRNDNFLRVGPIQSCARFDEEYRVVWDRHVCFFRMVAVVKAQTADDRHI